MAIQRPRVGAPAPTIALPTADGNRWHLTDQRGRAVLVVFHRHIH